MRGLSIVLTVAFLVIAPQRGAAETAVEATPRQMFLQGVELFGGEQYDAALELFERSYAANPVNLVLYNMAMCQRALFRYVESIDSFQRYLALGGDTIPAERQEEVQELIEEMSVQLGILHLVVEPEGASVLVDGRAVGAEHLSRLRLRSGLHDVVVRAPGFRDLQREIRVEPQRVTEVRVQLAPEIEEIETPMPDEPVEVSPVDPVPEPLDTPPEERRGVHRQWWFWTIVGVVVAGGALGLGLGLGLDGDDPLAGADRDWRLP